MRLTGRRAGVALVAAAAALTATATATAGSASAAPDDTLGRYIVVLDAGTDAGAVAAEHARNLGVLTGHVYSSRAGRLRRADARRGRGPARGRPAGRLRAGRPQGAATAQTMPTGINRVDADPARPPRSTASTSASTSTSRSSTPASTSTTPTSTSTGRRQELRRSRSQRRRRQRPRHRTSPARSAPWTTAAGVVGVAPGARIWPVKVLNAAGIGFSSDIICGIDYVTANAATIEVANMSLGGGGTRRRQLRQHQRRRRAPGDLPLGRRGRDLRGRGRQRLRRRRDLGPGGLRRGHHRQRAVRLQRPARWRRGRRPAARTSTTRSPTTPTTAPTST